MDKRSLNNFQTILEQRKDLIIKQLDDDLKELEGLHNSEPNDSIDFSLINTSSQIENTIDDNLKQELKDIDRSLSKIKQKNYGICELCADDIALNRLKIKPHARYCVSCREIIEKEKK
ncbi:RNA polymerase-binding protein DksA [Campylobacter troglodytis]|uniref:RNA polymerase-binding protein DksA n=1 Tax=Campylobacter troglodytis TaxID=654363 RepID=UPI00115B4C3B|nr:RNA polymerase-binding protein DksA [Campylobacter troglodytis]TQR59021.1 RNA polymerase-binding protein DksA [Campylobacter troglodytis]